LLLWQGALRQGDILENKINEAVCRYGMEEIFNGAILGFSGGADSGALLHYLKDRCGCLLAVHINHMIRGSEADRDEAFCKSVCLEYGVEFKSFKVDIPKLSRERKQGLEETARQERYRIFSELLEADSRYKCIVTAHNANDNAETVLFNLARGSGANGLCGIKPVFGKIYRPLIYSTRNDIINYCNDNNVKYVVDSTNNDTDYTRNRIRHLVLPQLMEINPGFLDSCTRLGEILRQDEEYIWCEAKKALSAVNDGKIHKEVAKSLDGAVLSRVLKALGGQSVDFKATKACIALIDKWNTGKMVNLGSGLTFKTERDYCGFIRTEETKRTELFYTLNEGINYIEELDAIIAVNCDCEKEEYRLSGSVKLNPENISGQLYVRNKRDGDCVKSAGMTKKLKRVFCDLHIPSHLRSRLPIICDDGGVLAVPGIVARDGAFDKKGKLSIKTYFKSFSNGGINEKEE